MAYDYRHIENGHAIHVVGRQLTVDGQVFTCPVGAFSPRVSPIHGWVAFAAQEPGDLNGVPFDGGAILTCNSGQFAVAYARAALGRQPCAWGQDDRLHVLVASNGANLTDVLAIAPDGSTHPYQIAKWASEGIWKIRRDGSVLLANEKPTAWSTAAISGIGMRTTTGAIGEKTDADHPQLVAQRSFDPRADVAVLVPSTERSRSTSRVAKWPSLDLIRRAMSGVASRLLRHWILHPARASSGSAPPTALWLRTKRKNCWRV